MTGSGNHASKTAFSRFYEPSSH